MSRPQPAGRRAAAPARPVLVVIIAALALLTGLLAVPAAALAPATPSGLPAAIEPLARYNEQVSCDPQVRPGTAKLANLLVRTYASAHSTWASTYACGTDGTRSEHYDGRAIDWMVSVRNTAQHKAAQAAIAWLLATDAAGNPAAMARRLGVMYLIYDNRMWGSWSGRWEQYNGCASRPARSQDNACHRTHVHISLSWNGAMGTTSYWTKRLSPVDYGPCRVAGLNWAPRYVRANPVPCPRLPQVTAPAGATAVKKALVAYSGAAVRSGWKGPAVTAVQRALRVSATGTYDAATVRAVKAFQAKHVGVPVTGAMNVPTWFALLAAVR